MIYTIVFMSGMGFPYVAWWITAILHDYVYVPFIWSPRYKRHLAKILERE